MNSQDGKSEQQLKSVRVLRGRETRTRKKWQRRGWELANRRAGRVRTELTFFRARPRRHSRFLGVSAAVVLVVTVGLVAGVLLTIDNRSEDRDAKMAAISDVDKDGLPDRVEKAGWRTVGGKAFVTDPNDPDTDDDGLTDGDEAGSEASHRRGGYVYAGYSDPRNGDSDDDKLGDAEEADLVLDPLNPDSDDDKLKDGVELKVIGTAPDAADTDGDGFKDGYEEANRDSKGLNPLWTDVKVSRSAYITDFAKGAVAGDLWREDSLAWLAGNLTSGGTSSIPVFGSVVGGLADVRDAIGSAFHADWVGSGFSAVGAVPGGDVVAIPGKAAKFVARNPELAAAVATIIVSAKKVPQAIKVKAAKKIYKHWDDLRAAGSSDKALLRLQQGGTNLDQVAAALNRSTPSVSKVGFVTWQDGEKALADRLGAGAKGVDIQVRTSLKGCQKVCNGRIRILDVKVDGVAHESKVGRVAWSEFTRNQIRSDAWLVKKGVIERAHWNFMASARSDTIGADPRILDMLVKYGITYSFDLPAKG